ncbi:endocuticle structural glycoprotein SgAbd-2-like [Phlebotomus argentipes]|uniref:endocuticle structural glycoprotein SgAbd-2-like n=1 Tax=Phlebotomus argentipes TaxID=94469 RepID=UPI002893098A|nr:endocuticle structural glycoprotein SgAbd-2-like [Phlebotomus argentipes]
MMNFLSGVSAVMLLSAVAAVPQQGGYQYNRNQYNQPLGVQPLLGNPGQQFNQQQGFSQSRNSVPITSYTNEVGHDGSFTYAYTTGDGQGAQAQGYLKNAGNKDLEAQVVQGSYSYTAPDGTPISVKWFADENGFRAEGLHLPTPPPIPEAIAKSLQFIARAQNLPQSGYNQYQNDQGFNKYG